ncbi:gnat family protein [Diaporthe amygdali]|uniref:gnat family protein n=1 Tax=Phomopsis amygdali TaxID=1214568 RepID=UPI0022FE1E7D|nr:gnat family protein [Diaporthe amygdali]KAJ0118774.1 gnat family protein [Diaporthe amygdali]
MMDVKIRPATVDDVDFITSTTILSFSADKDWQYRYRYAAEFPEDHFAFTRHRILTRTQESTRGAFRVVIAEAAPSESRADAAVTRVGYGVWHLPGQYEAVPSPLPPHLQHERKDADPERLKTYRAITAKAKDEVFRSLSGGNNIDLVQIAVLPEFRRLGVGGCVVSWGLSLASDMGVPLTLFANDSMSTWYEKKGFRKLGTVHVQVDGEDPSLESIMMAKDCSPSVL